MTAASSPSATATFYGSMGGKPLNAPIVGIAATQTGKGYWEVATDGGIFAFGARHLLRVDGRQALERPHRGDQRPALGRVDAGHQERSAVPAVTGGPVLARPRWTDKTPTPAG